MTVVTIEARWQFLYNAFTMHMYSSETLTHHNVCVCEIVYHWFTGHDTPPVPSRIVTDDSSKYHYFIILYCNMVHRGWNRGSSGGVFSHEIDGSRSIIRVFMINQ